ncbi:hypothetical protein SAMN05446037_105511 [Anaerovirgula multivorans]|uniref:Uncharacterized protein n=1 Tax=Anaerovirgula multivorans TaxID=312168 RepID=A0A239KUZ6_9FIRM|nr:hypothetical protein SAMN05446037_105511 [Anaerovirgula multivorans]
MLNYWCIVLFISFPESVLILLLGFHLTNIRNANLYKILIISAIQAIISLFLLIFMIGAEYATILQIASLYVLVLIFFQFQYYKAIIPVLIGSFIQGILQSIIFPFLSSFLKIEIMTLQNDFKSGIICFFPVLLISVLLFLFIRKKNYYVWDIIT